MVMFTVNEHTYIVGKVPYLVCSIKLKEGVHCRPLTDELIQREEVVSVPYKLCVAITL